MFSGEKQITHSTSLEFGAGSCFVIFGRASQLGFLLGLPLPTPMTGQLKLHTVSLFVGVKRCYIGTPHSPRRVTGQVIREGSVQSVLLYPAYKQRHWVEASIPDAQ